MYVTKCMSQNVCHKMYVTKCMSQNVCQYFAYFENKSKN
jgi:hypothetical protein